MRLTDKLLMSCLLSVCMTMTAQTASTQTEPVNYPTVISPQVESMLRYDFSTANLNSGTICQTIPLVEFEDPDFDLDISITYSMDGFKPLQPDNYVGMGWQLDCIGVITREINGIPDEYGQVQTAKGFSDAVDIRLNGFLSGAKGTSSLKTAMLENYNLEDRFRYVYIGERGIRKIATLNNGTTEMSPDVYHFRFGRHSGKFMMDIDGTIRIVSNSSGQYRVTMPNSKGSDCNANTQTSFSITTDDGYVYIFGGKYDALEYTACRWGDFCDGQENYEALNNSRDTRYNEVVAFYLSKIIAPNGRELNISYVNTIPDDLHRDPTKLLLESSSISSSLWDNYRKQYVIYPSMTAKDGQGDLQGCDISYTLNKIALISSISTADQRIDFNYANHSCPYFCLEGHDNSYYNFVSGCGAKLTSVSRWNLYSGRQKERTDLNYNTVNSRLLLKSVTNTNFGRYDLDYYSPQTFNKSLTIDIDKWGYWNGHGSNTSLCQLTDAYGVYDIDEYTMTYPRLDGDTNREPSAQEYAVFMLKSVTFPTGGNITYSYEPHTYSAYYSTPYSNGYVGTINGTPSVKKTAGGARLFKETFNDGVSEKKRIRYYDYDLSPNVSSGVLKTEGENYLKAFFTVPITEREEGDIGVNMSLPSLGGHILKQSTLGGHIGYSQIIEYDYESGPDSSGTIRGPYKKTTFSEPVIGVWTPITFYTGNRYTSDEIYLSWAESFLRNYYHIPPDYSQTFGKILSEKYYTPDDRLIKSIDHTYEILNRSDGVYINCYPGVSGTCVKSYSQVATVPFFLYLPTTTKTTEYDINGNSKTTSESFIYDSSGYVSRHNITEPDGRTTSISYTYPSNYSDEVHNVMKNRNILSPTITETVVIDSTETTYRRRNDYDVLDISSSSDIIPTYLPVLSAVSEISSSTGTLKTQAEYKQHDIYGNPLWIVTHGRSISCVWGYQGRYLMAVIHNATPSEINSVLGYDIDEVSMMDLPPDNIGDLLRSRLTNAQVTSYTYDPGVGMVSETGPDGLTLHYEYDECSRLSSKYLYSATGAKSIVEKYDYHLVNQ